jgi:hypothetical protein
MLVKISGESGTVYIVKCNIKCSCFETEIQFLKCLNIVLLYSSAVSREIKTYIHIKICITEALFIIAQSRNIPNVHLLLNV